MTYQWCPHGGTPPQTVLAHPGLREFLDPLGGELFPSTYRIAFADYDTLLADIAPDVAAIALPVGTEQQAELLRAVRAQRAMTLIVAVTNDVTGHATYFAIRAGANFVVNVAISGDRQTETLRAHLSGHRSPVRRDDTELLDMLRSSMTVAEIARRSYMSERSMYRRIRSLYDALGVVSRAELLRTRGVCFDETSLREPGCRRYTLHTGVEDGWRSSSRSTTPNRTSPTTAHRSTSSDSCSARSCRC
nr:response regulator transcription factor [Nocardia panacis]